MIIQTKRLTLRPLGEGDLHTAHAYAGCPENGLFIEFLPNETLEDTANFLRWAESQWKSGEQKCFEFAIIFEDVHIGAASANLEGDKTASIGWIIRKDHWGKGFATEAAEAVLGFAFEELGMKKVVATCDYRNTPSIKVMEKIGMTLENGGGLRNYKDGGKDVQELMYSAEKLAR